MPDEGHVLHATLVRHGPTLDGQQLTGLLLPATAGTHGEVRLAGTSLPVEWGEASPGLDNRFPGVPGSTRARFRATYPPELTGRAQLLLHDAEGGVHEVATCEVPDLPDPARRLSVAAVRARTEELVAGVPREDGEHLRLHRSLVAIPVPERDPEWLETLVLLNLLFRAHARNTFTNLQALRDVHGGAGSERFGAFWRRSEQVLHPDTLTPHGYEPGLAGRDPAQLWAEVAGVAAAVRDLGSPAFLAAGTLLGLVRDRRPIPHDYDADLIVVVPGADPASAVEGLWELKERLAEAGLLSEDYERAGHHHARVVSPSGLPVDLFPAWVDAEDRLHAWPTVAGTLSATSLLPGTTQIVAGVELPLPQDPEQLLVANYGPGWRDPDPAFQFPWGEARTSFVDYVAASSARQATSRWRDA